MKIDPFSFDITPSAALTEVLDAGALFQSTASHPGNSPIDRYRENSNKLSMIYMNPPFKQAMTPELGAVLLLGYVSAVESYMRGIIRGLIHIDEYAKNLAAPKQLSYFAASNHDSKLLPEALLDSVSFSGSWNVSTTLKEFCGITGMGGGNYPKELKPVFAKFSDICQLRHCCVHRFGLLGAGNAHKLRVLDKNLIEKPLALTVEALDDISAILEKFVLSLNSYIYRDVLERSFIYSKSITLDESERQYKNEEWARDYTQDESRFTEYHNLFAVTSVKPVSSNVSDSYVEFQKWMNDTVAKIAKENAAKARSKAAQPGTPHIQPANIAPAVSRPASPLSVQPVTSIPVKLSSRVQKLLSWLERLFIGSK